MNDNEIKNMLRLTKVNFCTTCRLSKIECKYSSFGTNHQACEYFK